MCRPVGVFLAGAYRSIAGRCWPVLAAVASAGSDVHRGISQMPQCGGAYRKGMPFMFKSTSTSLILLGILHAQPPTALRTPA